MRCDAAGHDKVHDTVTKIKRKDKRRWICRKCSVCGHDDPNTGQATENHEEYAKLLAIKFPKR